ncbi:MAG: type II toxin-antitoxin system prevent-host-death family antitoxin [Gammaproteobacteria bacterium]|nr:type II toxin-antitoxin system prevent-host-death family antitoxin [Gammaproteobacteria bacterium]MCH9743942.1 type II toxin-antitoxin system prevent-host-death family antitoxin [Gammaproteobacteria bacterium]
MRVVGSFEAKTHFSKLLAEVSTGEKILITKNGKTVAMLVPAEIPAEESTEETIYRMRKLRKKLAKNKISLADIQTMKNKGRK